MIYQSKSPQTIFDIQNREGLIEANWRVQISPDGVRYKWDGSNIVEVDLLINEVGSKFQHGRTAILNTNGGSWDEQRVVNEVLKYLGDNFELDEQVH